MINKKLRTMLLLLIAYLSVNAQNLVEKDLWEMCISHKGHLSKIVFKHKDGNDTIPFFQNSKFSGPSFYAKKENIEKIAEWKKIAEYTYLSQIDGIECTLFYTKHKQSPAIEVTLINKTHTPYQPQKAGFKLGLNTYMDKYPDWFGKYFPTLLRNEKTHFYAYFQTPKEHVLTLVSEQPVASWSIDYNLGYQDPPPHWFMGHRIESVNIDLLNQLPLPDHNPQHLYELKQNESKKWLFVFNSLSNLENLEQSIRQKADIPLIYAQKTSCRPMQEIEFEVYGYDSNITIYDDQGQLLPFKIENKSVDIKNIKVVLPQVGLYRVNVKSQEKEAEAILSAHHSWQWVLEHAREAALIFNQKATSHAESYYGFYSAFIAQKYFPKTILDQKFNTRFDFIFNKLHNIGDLKPLYLPNRIQNTSTFIGILTDKYQAGGDIEDLKKAAKLADWLITNWQRKDGAYFNHGTVYTSVIYVAKSILELALIEKELGKKDSFWNALYQKHYSSAKKAIDQLVSSQGNFQTEGELTFEDGMISCSALQIGMLATLQDDLELRQHYTKAMLDILNSHSCLTQLRVPDARRRQGTMRYWEAQYDVQMLPNMFNSPHGWSGWRAYATYYAYLLTGEEKWLTQTFNAMGAFANLIDYKSGQLRWAFVVDPHLEVEQVCEPDSRYTFDDDSHGNPHPHLYKTRRFIIGEQYVNMISDWQPINTQDNDVHELFKCMGEAVLTNAFIIEQADGTFTTYNCKIDRQGNIITVIPDEKQITNLHLNLNCNSKIKFSGQIKSIKGKYLGWFDSIK